MTDKIQGPDRPTFFATPTDFRTWLAEHHHINQELWVGFYKKGSGKASITWPEAVDEALCFGWIDGVRKSIDDVSYVIRFTPRKRRSTWSTVNIQRIEELTRVGQMQPAGLAAFAERTAAKSSIYAYEQTNADLIEVYEQRFRANKAAWDFFETQPAWYRRTAIWWVISAKKEETKLKRLATLIEDSAQKRTIRSLTRQPRPREADR